MRASRDGATARLLAALLAAFLPASAIARTAASAPRVGAAAVGKGLEAWQGVEKWRGGEYLLGLEDLSGEKAHYYDYGPSTMAGDGPIKMWWTAPGPNPNYDAALDPPEKRLTDNIWYSEMRQGPGGRPYWTAPRSVLKPTKGRGSWDSEYVADPTVIKGSWRHWEQTWAYAMYFTG